MGSPAIFAGNRTKLLSQNGLLLKDGTIIDNDGVKNFIRNPRAEVNTTGWATYADAAGTRPVDGTGGSPNVTWTRSTTSPLSDAASFIFTKDASNRQGQGVSYEFTIDSAYKAKVLKIEADYIVNSGTFVAGSSTTDSDVIVYIYDVTNSTLIEPSSFKFLSNSTSISDKFSATFQTSATGTQYRLIFHVASTSTSAYALKIDNVSVSPSQYVYGTPITQPQNFTPILSTGALATGGTQLFNWRRNGNFMDIQFTYEPGANVGTAGSGSYILTIPDGKTIDTAFVEANGILGSGYIFNGSTIETDLIVVYSSSNQIAFKYSTSATAMAVVGSSNFPLSNSGTRINFQASVPIQGWSSSVQMSDSADTRVVAANVVRDGTQSIANATYVPIVFDSIRQDTHGAYNTSNGRFTAPVSGFYKFSGSIFFTVSGTGTYRYVGFSVNGGAYTNLNQVPPSTVVGPVLPFTMGTYLNVGDYLQIVVNQDSGGSLNISGSCLYIARESGPSSIAASETVAARYTNFAGTAMVSGSTTIVPFATSDYDTHGAWNGSEFNPPEEGIYQISAAIMLASGVSWGTGSYVSIRIFEVGTGNNLVIGPELFPVRGETGVFPAVSVNTSLRLRQGQKISINLYQNQGTNITLITDSRYNYIAISKVK